MRVSWFASGVLRALLMSGMVAACSPSEPTPGGADAGEDLPPEAITKPAKSVQEAAVEVTKSAGGQVVTQSGAVAVPKDALAGDTTLKISEVDASQVNAKQPAMMKAVSPATAFEPHDTVFEKAVTLTVFYEAKSDHNLVVLRLDDDEDKTWERVPDAKFDKGAATVHTTHFSIYTVSECDPAADAEGYCPALLSGERDLNDLSDDLYKPFEPPTTFGDGVPEDAPDAGNQAEPDASDMASPDAGADEDTDAGSSGGDVRDASAPTHVELDAAESPPDMKDAGPGGSGIDAGGSIPHADGGSTDSDGAIGPGDCEPVYVCDPRLVCPEDVPDLDAGPKPIPDGGAGGDGGSADAAAPMPHTCAPEELVEIEQCHWDLRCPNDPCAIDPAACEQLPDGCERVEYCAEVERCPPPPPSMDAGCVLVEECMPPPPSCVGEDGGACAPVCRQMCEGEALPPPDDCLPEERQLVMECHRELTGCVDPCMNQPPSPECFEPRPPADGGTPPPSDAGLPPPLDGGKAPPPDGGMLPPPDGGMLPPPDGGMLPPPDGGMLPPPDGGMLPPPDGGTQPPPDGGKLPPPDGGTLPPPDGGMLPPPDGGTLPPPDGGMLPPPDGGTLPPPPDSGTLPPPDGGTPPPPDGGKLPPPPS